MSTVYKAPRPEQVPIHISETFKELHKSGGVEVINVPMTIKTLKEFNDWLSS